MENAVDALKMAAAILIFVIAIASSFSLFGTAKRTADSIITMRDKQAYLDSAEVDGGILYTSTSAIKGDTSGKFGVTQDGDRIVSLEDVISTIYRYSKEKYGVTIVDEGSGTVIARFDSNTEEIMSMWYRVDETKLENQYIQKLNENTKTKYVSPNFSVSVLENLYKIKVRGASIAYGAPWYGNEQEIQKRIACDLSGSTYEKYDTNGVAYQTYQGKGLISSLQDKIIIEVTNEVDNSKYIKQTDESGSPIVDEHGEQLESDLLQEYVMPTIEIVYIIR